MFTGLIEDVGCINSVVDLQMGKLIEVCVNFDTDDVEIGSSIALNGACQTVIKKNKKNLFFEAMFETIQRTNFNQLKKGDKVNIERAMKFNSRLDGHLVLGHVDFVSKLNSIKKEGLASVFNFENREKLVVEKGSIALNGVSLTISKVFTESFNVSVLPYTLENTNFKFLKPNDLVNIEYDIIAKYIKNFVEPEKKSQITEGFLEKCGFLE